MKLILLSVIIVVCFASTTLAALALGPAQVHSSQPGHCYQETTKKFYKPGESWTEEGCMEASCLMVNYTGIPRLMISYASCGAVGVEPPCYLTENKVASYPDCCPEPVCPESSEETTDGKHHTTPSKPKDSYESHDFENEIPKEAPHYNNIYPNNPWDDDYFYNDQDHMDNNVDDLQYLEYYPSERTSAPRFRFTRHDFNIDNFRWF